jgi:hypothetical protein
MISSFAYFRLATSDAFFSREAQAAYQIRPGQLKLPHGLPFPAKGNTILIESNSLV